MGKALIATMLLALIAAGPVVAAIDMDDVLRMLDAGVDEGVILKAIDADDARVVVFPEDLIDLTDAGASDWFLRTNEPNAKMVAPALAPQAAQSCHRR